MKQIFVTFIIGLLFVTQANAQVNIPKPSFGGVYFQWGYNRNWYTKSDIRISDGDNYDFTLYDVEAVDKPDFGYWKEHPFDITIPQNSYRVGVYLNEKRTHAIELNYDHAKYVQVDSQTLRMKGFIGDKQINTDTNLLRYIVHVEHTNGANFYHLNYVGQTELLHSKKWNKPRATAIWKAGGGVVIPKSYIVLFYEKLDNRYKVAGYIFSAEVGLRFYPFKNFFLEATAKGGYANYVNALGLGTGRINHDFWYGAVVGLVGYDVSLNFLRNPVQDLH